MIAWKLITWSDGPRLRISTCNGATRCHCPPFTQAEMAAWKLITWKSWASHGQVVGAKRWQVAG
eukprot:7130449-Karenia_brevis.AAC.1